MLFSSFHLLFENLFCFHPGAVTPVDPAANADWRLLVTRLRAHVKKISLAQEQFFLYQRNWYD